MLRASGVIRSCAVKAGDAVRQGDLLLELDNSTHRADVELARRQLESARAEVDHVNAGVNPYRIKVAEQTVERLREKVRHHTQEVLRYRRLLSTRTVNEQDAEAVETQRRQAEVELREQEAELQHLRHHVTPENKALLEAKFRQAQANLDAAEERLRETQLRAPFDGTVLKLLKREGEAVSNVMPEPVLLFGDLSRLRVRAEIDERFVRQLAVGQEAEVFGRNLGGTSYLGRLVQLEKVMGDKTVFSRASSERKNLDVLQAVIEMEAAFQAPVGLQVDVRILVPGSRSLR
jgi:multidrug resistance efflux pump